MKFFYTPNIVQSLFRGIVWKVNQTQKTIHLTFDDGPNPIVTEWVIETLALYQAKATFFCVGDNITKNPIVFNKIIDSGHSIGNHTNNHLNGWQVSTEQYIDNVRMAQQKVDEFRVSNKHLFRPPYGKIKPKQYQLIKQQGYKIVYWDVLTYDFDVTLNITKLLSLMEKKITNGSIICMHDSEKSFENLKQLLPQILQIYSKKGFEFRAL